jgi:alpha-methylacyl-CoA racemase
MAQMAGHDINYLGLTGLLHAIGPSDAPPPPPLNVGADYAGGTMFLLFGIMAALYERQTSGKGQTVDAAMVDGASALMALIHNMIAKGLWSETRNANLLDGGAPFYRSYECADGLFIAVGPLEPQFFAELLRHADLPGTHGATQMAPSTWPDKHALYTQVFRQKTRDEWAAIFDQTDACATPILRWSEAPSHPHLHARKTFTTVNGVAQASPAPRFDRTPAGPPTPPPAPGADTETLLQEVGCDPQTLARLRAAGALT